MGQPYFSRHPAGSAPWQQDRVDTPYDLSVGSSAPKPGWAYDPDVAVTGVINYQDNLFTPSQLERVLRLFEPGVETVSPRLLSLLGRDAEKARLTVTTESWDSAATCIPWPVLHPLLSLSDQADRTKPSLLSWDLQMGLRMDVNRPFGDGVDNNGNGVIDEPAEAAIELDTEDRYGLKNDPQFSWHALTNGRDVDGNGTVDVTDQQLARQLYARHLFVLAMRAVSGLQLPSNKLADYRREAAQWAVNVVDFRDTDSIMTRFEYPNGFDPTTTTWAISNKANVGVVWGCERPDLLLTETLAWRNIQERGSPLSLTYTDDGTGGLVVEVYNPWSSLTSDGSVRGNPLPAEFASNPSSRYATGVDGAIDLAKRNTDDQPVFQLLIVDDSPENERSMLEKPEWPAPSAGAVKAIIYMGQDGPVDGNGKPFDGATATTPRWALHQGGGSTTTLRPGQFGLVAGPRASDNVKMLPIISQSGQQEGLTFHPAEQRLGLEVPEGTPRTLTEFVVTPSATVVPPPTPSREEVEHDTNGRVRRVADGLYPNDAPAVSPATATQPLKGPVGAIVMVTKPTDQNAILTLPTTLPSPNLQGLIDTFSKRHRILLRRLANPLATYHPDDNPYLTVDSIAVQDQGVIMDNPDDPAQPESRGSLRAIDRCAAQKPVAGDQPGEVKPLINNLWKQDTKTESDQHAWVSPSPSYRSAPNCFRRTTRPEGSTDASLRTLEASLGFLPPTLRVPIPSPDGNAPVPHVAPFPWLTWLNRDFASTHELLLVPKSSPSRLTHDHTEKWPYHHLFFGGGRLIPFGDPAKPTDPATEESDATVSSARFGIFEFLRVVNRFADAEQHVATADAVELSKVSWSTGGNPLLLPPHNYLSHFREPGRINLNTTSSADVWTALARPDSPIPYDDEIHYESATPAPGLKPLASFVSSEDWSLASNEDARQPESGNWSLDPSEDSVNSPNGLLDLNQDANNDGRQALTGSMAHVQSLMVSRRGWAFGDPSTQKIAGHFDRVLNREGAAQGQRWFSGVFKSAWARTATNEDLHSPAESLLMRPSSDAFVRLSRQSGYGRLRQSDISLMTGIQYVCRIDVRGDFSPGQNDHIPELWQKNTTNVYLPSSIARTYSAETKTTTIVAKMSVPASDSFNLSLALWSAPSIDIRAVSLKAPDGRELLANGTFSQGLKGWSADGGTIKLHGSPTLLFTRTLGLPAHSDGAAQMGRDYADPLRHPHFLYQDVVRLSNLVTPRSNVFAIWMTVGFFELDERDRLGAEYGLDNGSAIRHKAFQIIDRSIPVGYEPNGAFEGNSRNTVLHYHFTN
jgi:hypothetical protein